MLLRRHLEALDWDNLLGKSRSWGILKGEARNCFAGALSIIFSRLHTGGALPRPWLIGCKRCRCFAEDWPSGFAATRAAGPVCRDVRRSLARRPPIDRGATGHEGAQGTCGRAAPSELGAFSRKCDGRLPADCPGRLEQVAACDARRDREPHDDVWPPVEELGTVLRGH